MTAQEEVVAEGQGTPLFKLVYFTNTKVSTDSHRNTFSTVSHRWTIDSVLTSESAVRDCERACSFVRFTGMAGVI